MSDLVNVVALLKTTLTGVEVYTGEIPETETEPSILVQHVATPFNRTITGRKVRINSTWRITIVAKLQSSVESIMEMLDNLDNSTSVNFQRIYTNLVNSELGLIEQPYRRAFYDMTVYNR